jgi:hypothetical protein
MAKKEVTSVNPDSPEYGMMFSWGSVESMAENDELPPGAPYYEREVTYGPWVKRTYVPPSTEE